MEKNNEQEKAFVPPRHWIGPEELDAKYWQNAQTQEKRSQEFFEKPVEWLEKMDRTDSQGFARRDFLTLMGASMALATAACARRPVHKIIPYVVKPEEIIPGVANWYSSTCRECSTGCGIFAKNREGRPIKLEGNPDHPVNHGSLCARGQASILNLYDPERLKSPLVRSRGDAIGKETTWAEVDRALSTKLRRANRVRILTGPLYGNSASQLIREFLNGFSSGHHVEFEPLELSEISDAQQLSYGTAVQPHYDFSQADVICSLGADFLGTWNTALENSGAWSKKRKLTSPGSGHFKMSKFYCFEPTMTITGANADERYPIRPGDELKVAMAITHELMIGMGVSRFASDSSIVSLISGYSPSSVAIQLGMDDGGKTISKIAHDLWQARGKGLVVAGGIQSRTRDAVALQIAVNFLNSILENEGSTVDGTSKSNPGSAGFSAVAKLIQEMKTGQVDVLIIHRSNPLYHLPRGVGFEEAMKKVPLVVSVSDRDDETGKGADFVLPDHHYLENWGDSFSRKGTASIQQPVIAPLHNTRSFEDGILVWVKGIGNATGGPALRSASWYDYLQARWKQAIYQEAKVSGGFELFWETTLKEGFRNRGTTERVSARKFKTESLSQIPRSTIAQSEGIKLALYAKASMNDGRSANNAWLQELPDPISSVTWDNYLNVGPDLAFHLGVKNDDVVEVSAGDDSVELPVHVQPGMHDEAVSVAVGYGRRSVGKVGDFTGVDVTPFIKAKNSKLIYSGQTVSIKKTQKFYRLASTQWHTATENRPIINDITLTQFKKSPGASSHTDPHIRLETVPSLWPAHVYKGHRWGMAIDLNSCTGCGACMIACQAENNIPVVGRDNVRVSRQMHWIRIDRYFSGPADRPDVVFQPMLCQHCENASCETVCPVLATMHDDEGLNVQAYNRCVGTRYCQNNCPYKVRRFNFFDHWKSYQGTMNLAWNPDVTVRTRGIMEKCTFCTQRIRDEKEKAKDLGIKLKDGQIKPACEQTCPTGAIVFGDVNDPNSRVSRMRNLPMAFRVLEVLNNVPMISYMTKVRNKAPGNHEEKEHG